MGCVGCVGVCVCICVYVHMCACVHVSHPFSLLFFVLLDLFSLVCFFICLFIFQRETEGVKLDMQGSGENLGGHEGGETMIIMYCIRNNYFQ